MCRRLLEKYEGRCPECAEISVLTVKTPQCLHPESDEYLGLDEYRDPECEDDSYFPDANHPDDIVYHKVANLDAECDECHELAGVIPEGGGDLIEQYSGYQQDRQEELLRERQEREERARQAQEEMRGQLPYARAFERRGRDEELMDQHMTMMDYTSSVHSHLHNLHSERDFQQYYDENNIGYKLDHKAYSDSIPDKDLLSRRNLLPHHQVAEVGNRQGNIQGWAGDVDPEDLRQEPLGNGAWTARAGQQVARLRATADEVQPVLNRWRTLVENNQIQNPDPDIVYQENHPRGDEYTDYTNRPGQYVEHVEAPKFPAYTDGRYDEGYIEQ